ncbi:hypothetical protein Ciccas_009285, partial [Cichlidogyrus casuarinus]
MTDLQQKLAKSSQSKNYQRYPQLVDIPDFVNRINRGDPVSEIPMNDMSLFLVARPPDQSHLTGRAGSVLNEYNDKNKSQEIFRKVLKESETHQDILLGSYFDSYYNLTEKCITSWRWISQFCPNAQTVLVMDDDMWLDLMEIAEFLDSLTERQRLNIAAGALKDSSIVFRPTSTFSHYRWAVHPSDFPW